jgi:hypothetical protein
LPSAFFSKITPSVRRKKRICVSLLIFFFFFCGHWCSAQEDNATRDSLLRKKHSPRTAIIFSAVLPGLGQIYNGKYWKVPLVYGAGGAAVYAFQFNQDKYQKYKKAYNEGDENKIYIIDGYKRTYSQLPLGRDYYRRYRDISLFAIGAVYLLNIVDAMVDAYFKGFDVSDDLTLRIQPAIVNNFDLTAAFSLKFSIGF